MQHRYLEVSDIGDLRKRIMNVITNKRLFSVPSKPYNTFIKLKKTCVDSLKSLGIALRRGTKGSLWSIPETLQQQSQQEQQAPKIKEKLSMVNPPEFNNYVVNELHQDV